MRLYLYVKIEYRIVIRANGKNKNPKLLIKLSLTNLNVISEIIIVNTPIKNMTNLNLR